MQRLSASVLTFAAVLAVSLPGFGAIQVRYADNTIPERKAAADAGHLREEMEGWGSEICRLYCGSSVPVENWVVRFILGDGGIWSGGDTICLDIHWLEGVGVSDSRAGLMHEMGHQIETALGDYWTKQAGGADLGIDLGYTIKLDDGPMEHLTEPLADWVRRHRYAPRRERMETEYNHAKAGFGLPWHGNASSFIDYLCRAYGQEMLGNVLHYCSTNKEHRAYIDKNPEYIGTYMPE